MVNLLNKTKSNEVKIISQKINLIKDFKDIPKEFQKSFWVVVRDLIYGQILKPNWSSYTYSVKLIKNNNNWDL